MKDRKIQWISGGVAALLLAAFLVLVSGQLYALMADKPPVDTSFLKEVSHLSPKSYQQGFDFLLQNLYVTALANGKQLTSNWSTFRYGTADAWETATPNRWSCDNACERLWEILSSTMPEKLFRSLIR